MSADDDGIPVPRSIANKAEFEPNAKPTVVLHPGKKRKRAPQQQITDAKHENTVGEDKTSLETRQLDSKKLRRPHGQSSLKATSNVAPTTPKPVKGLNAKREALFRFRKDLPIWPSADGIRQLLRSKNIMILVGETGSGKSTQVPQFLLHEAWCTGAIAITQPRRVAAISLARRVAEEMGSPLGSSSPASKVGYSVRFDNSVSANTRIKYLTEGMLLQEMLRDPSLSSYSTVIVDEVHERSVNVDLILGFLRNLLANGSSKRKGKPLKVVVMSATADVEALVNFFNAGFTKAEKSNPHAAPKSIAQDDDADTTAQELHADEVATCHIQGRLFPVKVVYLPAPTQDFVEAALKIIFQIHYKEPLPGDILVFLTGQDTVESLERLVNEYGDTLGPEVPKILALPLFAALPQAAQQKVFQPAPFKTRKVILSTNIAETSVTVPGVRYVIDSGKMKMKQFRSRLGLDSLLVKPVSKSSAIQRKGRAGREAAGICFRLYTEKDYQSLEQNSIPEILRCDLSDALLGMKARGVSNVLEFPFLNPPSREALEKALLQLLQLSALGDDGSISDVGLQMAKLPLNPALGRVIVEAAKVENDCLADVIDIVACLNVESIFINLMTEEKKEEAEEARRELFRRDGDHLTLLAAVRGYAAEQSDRKAWARKYFVSHRAMQNVMDIRKQLFQQCKQLKLLPESASLEVPATTYSEARNAAIIKSLLRGFATNTARLTPDGSYKTLIGNQTVAIHPSSVLFGRRVEAILFTEFVFTSKSYGRNVSAVRLGWIDEALANDHL
ncbi:P-loop containing nucleoside triphosphate hydrolase protein [Microthyrium microscopicum]|uniref:RNA helicase n=1 Tax=Microthyrium microscopicum TaxID=703497 RepID=A0A6A6U0M7_9PEZI|nr:P-loop containing nucleoside triphosphate hydrolase protein [Microthyrium microscopicum]